MAATTGSRNGSSTDSRPLRRRRAAATSTRGPRSRGGLPARPRRHRPDYRGRNAVNYQPDRRVDASIDALPDWQQVICRDVPRVSACRRPRDEEATKRRVQPYFVWQGNICALGPTASDGGRSESKGGPARTEREGDRCQQAARGHVYSAGVYDVVSAGGPDLVGGVERARREHRHRLRL